MWFIDFILNLAGLLLWLNWSTAKADPLGKRTPATLIGTLRRADARKTRHWQIGASVHWAARLNLGVIELSFRSDYFSRMLLFSFCSFAVTLAVFYLWLLLLSILAGPEPIHALVRMQLGRVDRWRHWPKIFLPFIFVSLLWWLASWLLAWLQIIPQPVSPAHRLGASLLIGLGSYLVWKFLIAALLALHSLNSYVYFGKHPIWNYVDATARTLLRPLKKFPLRAGKADFAPIVGIALLFLLAELAGRLLALLYGRLAL